MLGFDRALVPRKFCEKILAYGSLTSAMMAGREGQTMKLISSIALAFGIWIQPTGSRADFIISGVGSVSCGKIGEEYRKTPKDIARLMMYWAQGFMNGANLEHVSNAGEYRDLGAMTIEAQEHSLMYYCDEHPMAEFSKAVIDLYTKLPMKKDRGRLSGGSQQQVATERQRSKKL
jgi:hypothetical protein